VEYFEIWIFHSRGVTPVKMLEAPFWELYNFFRRNLTENKTDICCQLEIVMNAGTDREYTAKYEGVWQIISPAQLTLQAGVN
jgi:hypothetical protein